MNRNGTSLDPIEWDEPETEKCTLCHNDLTPEEITEQDDDKKLIIKLTKNNLQL